MTRPRLGGVEYWRVAKIFSVDPEGQRRRVGSGYLVSAGRILTAAHVVEGREDIEIVIGNESKGHRLEVTQDQVWVAPSIDLGIVKVDPDWAEEYAPALGTVSPVRWGSRPEGGRVSATVCGFAAFKLRKDQSGEYRDSKALDVVIHRGSNVMEKTLELTAERAWEVDGSDLPESPWGSLSGSAVWADGVVIGIVSKHRRNEGSGVLIAQPVDRILALPEAQRDTALTLLGLSLIDFSARPTAATPVYGKPSSDFTVVPVPFDSRFGAFSGISGDRPAESLLTHLLFSRSPRSELVLDVSDGDLAADLNRAERAFRAARSRFRSPKRGPITQLGRRRWYTADLDADPEARGGGLRGMLLDGGSWSDEAEPAFVLRTAYKSSRARAADSSAAALLAHIREEHPDSSLVVHLRGRDPVTGVARARRFAGRHPLFRSIYLRRRGDFAPLSKEGLSALRDMHDVIEALSDAAVRAGHRSRLETRARQSPSPAPGGLKADMLAHRLVREIESTGIPAVAAVEDDDLDDALLSGLRDYLPRLYPSVLAAYAAHRSGSGWAVSMAFATQSEYLLESWLESARNAGVRPDGLHPWPTRYGPLPYGLLVHAAERGSISDVEHWRSPHTGEAVLDETSDWEDAETWRRLSSRVPALTADHAMVLVCSAEAAHPIVARVLGLAPVSSEGLVRDRIEELRHLLIPQHAHDKEN